ncbi:molybdenum cofactor guanylyltransferase [Halobacillus litoralis]|uniref:molybdenum cofactor guanylyltransferase n=1 Tax=Halobacillus litoralis TaxID=45668 RepID=UPI001CD4CF68|nr:molybdenum cofactor guanylyltransferase [Halobacillus litoralis]MCA1023234.1 molybdenum cofactor guanylyltransferase [Halobacillus litoralis]
MGGAVLNEGGSTRMGRDKGAMMLGGTRVLERILSRLGEWTPVLVINQRETHPVYPTVKEQFDQAGPLGGIHAVLNHAEKEWTAVTACDTPFLSAEVYDHLLKYTDPQTDAVIPVYNGRRHPLSGLYNKRCVHTLSTFVQNGGRKVDDFLEKVGTKEVHEFSSISSDVLDRHFFNMNTPEDYDKAEKWLKKEEGLETNPRQQ